MRRAVFTIVLLVIAFPAGAADIAGQASVIDGDTIEIHGQRIRFHGIDAPESAQQCEHGGKPWPIVSEAARFPAKRKTATATAASSPSFSPAAKI